MDRSLRSLAVEAGLTTREAVECLGVAGIVASNHSHFDGSELTRARKALDLDQPIAAKRLTVDELVVRMLRPLRQKGKVGSTHTTEFTNVWGHGVPPHQKDHARELAKRMVLDGLLAEKPSVGRRHVWLTERGLARLEEAEGAIAGRTRT